MREHGKARKQLIGIMMQTNPIKHMIWAAFAVLLLAGCNTAGNTSTQKSSTAQCAAGVAKGNSEAGLEQVSLCIKTAKKTHAYTVELARTVQEQAKGLMFRTALADDKGMLFPYSQIQTLSFWMKNTVIPLDIIFIRADGSIESIAKNAEPYSLKPIASGEPVAAVLELRGGLTSELDIGKGDVVTWK
jgi:uncharacterized membrane protein (UPF0127 family)